MRAPLICFATCFTLLTLTGCDIEDFGPSDRFHADFHYTYPLKPGGRLSMDNFNGQIEIEGWDQNKVDVTGTKFASSQDMLDQIKIEIHDSADHVEIRTVRPSTRHGNMGARYTIKVPRSIELDRIGSSNGHIRIQNVVGAARLKTSNGGVRAIHVDGDVDAQTSNGPIDLEEVKGSASMHTTNGRVHAEDIGGQCEADTSNGSISVRLGAVSAAPMKFSTTNGSIEINLQASPKGDVRASTNNGSITVHMPSSAGARVKADTSNSSISTDFEVVTTIQGTTQKKNHLDGTIGAGGPVLDLSTTNSPIRLIKGV